MLKAAQYMSIEVGCKGDVPSRKREKVELQMWNWLGMQDENSANSGGVEFVEGNTDGHGSIE